MYGRRLLVIDHPRSWWQLAHGLGLPSGRARWFLRSKLEPGAQRRRPMGA